MYIFVYTLLQINPYFLIKQQCISISAVPLVFQHLCDIKESQGWSKQAEGRGMLRLAP